MAVAAGAATTDLHAFYGHVLVREARSNPRLWPAPTPLPVISRSLVVDGTGRRFVDEWWGDESHAPVDDRVATAIVASRTPGDCWAVFDAQTWNGVAREGRVPLNPTLVHEGGTFLSAPTVEEIATLAGLPTDTLAGTIDAFNRFCRDGTPLDPPRTGAPDPIDRAPFHAIPLVAGITFTMGGVLVNGRAQVISRTGEAIPSLYAAGGTMGGLQGGPRHGYVGGWAEAATFGLIAAEDAVAYVRRRPHG